MVRRTSDMWVRTGTGIKQVRVEKMNGDGHERALRSGSSLRSLNNEVDSIGELSATAAERVKHPKAGFHPQTDCQDTTERTESQGIARSVVNTWSTFL
jgi:hypothetical protein